MAKFDGTAAGLANIRQLWSCLTALIKKLIGDVDLTNGDLQTQVNEIKNYIGYGEVPDGETVTPINDVSIWLKCGGISDKSYTTMSQVLADSTTLYVLMSDENAMKYLARSTEFADEGCANETFMTYLGQSPYVDETVLNSDIWSSAICDSAYFESVLNVSIPTMTSNTEPEGEATATDIDSDQCQPYKAFDKIITGDQNCWIAGYSYSGVKGKYIQYDFGFRIFAKIVGLTLLNKSPRSCYYILYGSNDNQNWQQLIRFSTPATGDVEFKFKIEQNESYRYFRLAIDEDANFITGDGNKSFIVNELQIYGRKQ